MATIWNDSADSGRPEARERIIRFMDWTKFPTFRAVGNKSISINWPHAQSRVFTSVPKKGLGLDPAFERHIRQLRNWTFGEELSDAFPFLRDMEKAAPKRHAKLRVALP